MQLISGRILGLARILYRAGTSEIPKPVERELFALVKTSYDGSKQNSALTGEKLGDYSYTAAKSLVGGSMSVNDSVLNRLSKYVRVTP